MNILKTNGSGKRLNLAASTLGNSSLPIISNCIFNFVVRMLGILISKSSWTFLVFLVLPKPSREETAPAVPPTSQLVGKLFPKLKEDKSKPKMEPRDEQRLTHAKHTEPESGIQCKQLRDKLAELEQEIEKFRSENNTLGRLRKEREDVSKFSGILPFLH